MLRFLLLSASAVALTACTVVPPSVRIDSPVPVVVVEPAGGPPHCPPGQAKKGNC